MDNITKPEHYTYGKYECIDIIHEITKDLAGVQAFCLGNTIKYLWRFQHKNGVEDLQKAKWYLEKLISEFGDIECEEKPKVEVQSVQVQSVQSQDTQQAESKNAQNIKKLINEYKYLPDETNWEAFKNNKLK